MRLRTALGLLLLSFLPAAARAETEEALVAKKRPLAISVSPGPDGLPLVTLTASDEPLSRVAERLAREIGATVDVSGPARESRVTAELDRQPLDLTLRTLAPQAWLDGILSGGAGGVEVRAVYLSTAGEAAPSLEKLKQRRSDVVMFYGHTEDRSADPFEGKLEVSYRDDRLRVFARSQPLVVVVSRIADALAIPLELVGDSLEVVDVSIAEGTLEDVLRALTPSAKLYYRVDLATFRLTPVRLVVEAPPGAAAAGP